VIYKVNGGQLIATGDCDSANMNLQTQAFWGCYAIGYSGSPYYMVYGSGPNDELNFGIDTRALTIDLNNAFGLGMRLDLNGTIYGFYNLVQDSMFVKITRFSNGSFDGIFSGSISDSSQTKKAVITDGRFTNVKAIYSN
jgi:hypothetical protein